MPRPAIVGPVRGHAAMAGLVPFGIGHGTLSTAWNALRTAFPAGSAPYAWRILTQGVCDADDIGSAGLWDALGPGLHLSAQRLEHVRLHTQPALHPSQLVAVGALARLDAGTLALQGRLDRPYVRRTGDAGFQSCTWEDAWTTLDDVLDGPVHWSTPAHGVSCETTFLTSRLAAARGEPHTIVGPPTGAEVLERQLGHRGGTCSLEDVVGTDLLLVFGARGVFEQAQVRARIADATRRHTRVVLIDDAPHPGLEAAWLPHRPLSALFGHQLVDDVVRVSAGGEGRLLRALNDRLVLDGANDHRFVDAHTRGHEHLVDRARKDDPRTLLHDCGVSRGHLDGLVDLVKRARNIVSLVSPHAITPESVQELVNLHLLRGAIGRPLNGLLTLAAPDRAAFALPTPTTATDRLFALQTDVHGPLPSTRVHAGSHLTPAMLADGDRVVLLPLQALHEQRGGGLLPSLDRRVRFSPEIADHPLVGEARSALDLLEGLARHGATELVPLRTALAVREAMAASLPGLEALPRLQQPFASVQLGGPQLHAAGRFATPDGRAKLVP